MNNIKFKRCVKPKDAANEQPTLIIFSDGSSNAFGACAYVDLMSCRNPRSPERYNVGTLAIVATSSTQNNRQL